MEEHNHPSGMMRNKFQFSCKKQRKPSLFQSDKTRKIHYFNASGPSIIEFLKWVDAKG